MTVIINKGAPRVGILNKGFQFRTQLHIYEQDATCGKNNGGTRSFQKTSKRYGGYCVFHHHGGAKRGKRGSYFRVRYLFNKDQAFSRGSEPSKSPGKDQDPGGKSGQIQDRQNPQGRPKEGLGKTLAGSAPLKIPENYSMIDKGAVFVYSLEEELSIGDLV